MWTPRRGTRRDRTLLLVCALALLVAACGSDPAATTGDGSADDAPQDLVAAAQEEGQVVLYAGAHISSALEAVVREFEELYGIEVVAVDDTSSGVVQKVEAELASGRLNADAVSLSDDATLVRWAEEGVTETIDLPTIDRLFPGLYDGERPEIPYSLNPRGIVYNEDRVDVAALPDRWEDLDQLPEGTVIAMGNPASSGSVQAWVAIMVRDYGWEIFEKLAAYDILMVDSVTAIPQLVITGEADVGIPATESSVLPARHEGEPVHLHFLEGDIPTTVSAVAKLADAPHPNAAELLVQYHLSEEFAETFHSLGGRSALRDVEASVADAIDLADRNLLLVDFDWIEEHGEEMNSRYMDTLRP